MTKKRLFSVFMVFVMGFAVLEARLYLLMMGSKYTEAAARQGSFTRTIAVERPNFYDRYGIPLTGYTLREYAVALPGDAANRNLLQYSAMEQAEFEALLLSDLPVLVPLTEPLPANEPFGTIYLRERYTENASARHLIGYLDYENRGVTGLEYVFDDLFHAQATETVMTVEVDALGRLLEGSDINVYEKQTRAPGVTLTIDNTIQNLAEVAAQTGFTRGAIVVMDPETFEILALVSSPDYDQNDVAAALENPDGPLVNRAINAYNIGSVYKPIVAAAALEAGISLFEYTCEGSIEVNGQSYSCNNGRAHGDLTLEKAMVYSCNSYFVALAQAVGSEAIYNMGVAMGLGRPIKLYEGYETARGNMPTVSQLKQYGELCNHSFGQGQLLATPIHVAAYTAAIANGGEIGSASLVKSVNGEAVEQIGLRQALSAETAAIIAECLYQTVEVGIGEQGRPSQTSAAGKTGTAQTGTYNENGNERVMGWFTGWFPAENPKYVVTVMTEDEGYGYASAAPVFKQLANSINEMEGVVASIEETPEEAAAPVDTVELPEPAQEAMPPESYSAEEQQEEAETPG